MLKTNCKKAMENVKNYIVNCFDPCGYDEFIGNELSFKDAAQFIYTCFYNEKLKHDNYYKAGKKSEYDIFEEWCSGLPSVLDTCYYYNRSAVDDLGTILEETKTEKSRYTEEQAEQRLTWLIYREIKKAVK